ncbi:MAG: glycoside hydrolase family 3 C-terminal domain-containing protein [Firmicutes bacterium]|nr:glycoside hydrolase family 3 C-terminal domain-containing protein [Bacillota bacterium]
MDKWTRYAYMPCLPLGADGKRVTGSKEHFELSRKAASEGIVLLKNDGLLPLKKGSKVAIFGTAQYDYVKCGGGSGDVVSEKNYSVYDGLKEKEQEGKVFVFEELSKFYIEDAKKQLESPDTNGRTQQPELPSALLSEAKAFADIAIVTICRYSFEGDDRHNTKGDFYLSGAEEKMVRLATDNFDKVFVVMNVGGVMDVKWFSDNDKISSALYIWNPGNAGGLAVADIICGDCNPSGKTVDTFACEYYDYPSSSSFEESDDYVKYYDDIYVGYRYFETIPGAAEKVIYPFGFGLSYTDFDITNISAAVSGDEIKVSAIVTNTGKAAGKEIVQVYFSAPQGKLGKPAKALAAFAKTAELMPGDSEKVSLSFKINDMASYDDLGKCAKSAYILEKGDYFVYVGNSIRNTRKTDFKYTVNDEFVVCCQRSEKAAPYRLEKRMLADGTFEDIPFRLPEPYKFAKNPENTAKAPAENANLIDVVKGKITLDEFLAQLSTEQLTELLGGKRNRGIASTCGFGDMSECGIPPIMTGDGPAGLRVTLTEYGFPDVYTTTWPCETLLACTWNTALVSEVTAHGAMEFKENGFGIWLAPGMNIHRSPLCGRNFEYFSEDPLITGEMGAAYVKGVQSQNIVATPKHFACNNKEHNRSDSDSIVSERALREIYLKGFEICVKKSNPWLIMTSYNMVNGTHSSENYDLITGILRGEWGFNGAVTTDWRTHGTHAKETKAGNDIKMPFGYPETFKQELDTGRITRSDIEVCAKRILELILRLD